MTADTAADQQLCPLDGVVLTEVHREIGECGCLVVTYTCPGDCAGEMRSAFHRPSCPTVDPEDIGTVSLRIEFDPPLALSDGDHGREAR